MNTAAGLCTGSPLQVALQMPSDPAAPLAAGGDFTSVLAAACVAEPETDVPEGMQSAAALAWLAGLISAAVPTLAQPGAKVQGDSSDMEVGELQSGSDVVPAATLSFLQGIERTVAPPTEAAANFNPGSIARSVDLEMTPEESDIASGDAIATGAPDTAVSRAPPVPAPLAAMMRALNTDAQSDASVPLQGDVSAATSIAADSAANDASTEPRMGDSLISALADRVSMRTESTHVAADPDRSVLTGPQLYASTREAVASTAGAVSSRPEVVHSTVGSPRWANELGSRLAMMSVRGQQEGSLSLTPDHLGPLEVRITVNQDTTNVWFGAQHADTRAALADALPRLREMFAESGLALGQAGVSHEMPRQEARRGGDSVHRFAEGSEPMEAMPVATRISSGLLDTWA